jgi:predicted nucleotidyltransferase
VDFRSVLIELRSAGARFVVIGGVGAILQGAPTMTFDVDIVHARDEENRRRLLEALRKLDARYREHLPKVLRPTEDDLASDGHLLLMTSHGPLDVLGKVVGDRTYEDLSPRARLVDLGDGIEVEVLDLEALIQLKEETGRDKDHLHLKYLRMALEDREQDPEA